MPRRLLLSFLAAMLIGCQPAQPPAASTNQRLAAAPPPSPTHPANAYGQSYAYPTTPAPRYAYPATPRPAYTAPRAAAPQAHPWSPSAPHRRWQYIVIHHSDTANGSAETFRRYHVQQRRWQDLGYHFVIGNGTHSADGQVEVGGRWTRQETGAHAGVLKYNEYGIGICLVGDFDANRPTSAQMQSLARLTGHLMRTYGIPATRVIGHRDAKDTNCPGRHMNLALLRSMASRVAQANTASPLDSTQLARAELLHDIAAP